MNHQFSIKAGDIASRFPQLFSETVGDSGIMIDRVTTPDQASAGSLVFVSDAKFQNQALMSQASAIVLSPKSKEALNSLTPQARDQKVFLFSKNVKLAMALVKKEYFSKEIPLQKQGSVHPTAIISSTTKLGKNVSVGAYSVIGENVILEDDVCLDASVIIEADCHVGKGSHLYSHLYIGPRTEIGENCELMPHSTIGAEGFGFAHDEKGHFYRIPQTGKVVLENNVEIGSHCTIDRATFGVTRIGEGTKIDKQCHIAHNCQIGKHCVIAASFAVAGSTKIGNHFIAGGRITMRDGITIADGVELAAGSGVHNHITLPGKYGGHPLQPVKDSMRTIRSMAHLPRMRKQVSRILKHLGLEDEGENKEDES